MALMVDLRIDIRTKKMLNLTPSNIYVCSLFLRHVTIKPCLVLVQPRKTCPGITEKLLKGTKRINSNKNIQHVAVSFYLYRLSVSPADTRHKNNVVSTSHSHFSKHSISINEKKNTF